jgi:hypothetical protein
MRTRALPPRQNTASETVELVNTLAPTLTGREVDEIIARIPAQYHPAIHEGFRINHDENYRMFAAATAAILAQEALQPNSVVMHWTAPPYGPGVSVPAGLPVQLVPYKSGVAQAPFQFVRGQRFFGLITATIDTNAGWNYLVGTPIFSVDAISGFNYSDVSFVVSEQDVVLGRMVTGEYERHTVLEQVQFSLSAIHGVTGGTAEAMVAGVGVQFWDFRCRNTVADLKWFEFMEGNGFAETVDEVIRYANGGFMGSRLLAYRERFSRR